MKSFILLFLVTLIASCTKVPEKVITRPSSDGTGTPSSGPSENPNEKTPSSGLVEGSYAYIQRIMLNENETYQFKLINGYKNPFIYKIDIEPKNGKVSGCGNETTSLNCSYKPNTNYYGTDFFTYRASEVPDQKPVLVEITVNHINQRPVISGTKKINLKEDGSIGFSILDVVSDVDDKELIFDIVKPPLHGKLENCLQDPSGSCTYQANQDYAGKDFFTYRVRDPQGLYALEEGKIEFEIEAVNAPPRLGEDQTAEVKENQIVDIAVNKAYDREGDPIYYNVLTSPSKGTYREELIGDVLHIFYTPAQDDYGTYYFVYGAKDAKNAQSKDTRKITVKVLHVNQAPRPQENPIFKLTAGETQEIKILKAKDPDNDEFSLNYSFLPIKEKGKDGEKIAGIDNIEKCHFDKENKDNQDYYICYITTDVDAKGMHKILYTVSDGQDTSKEAYLTFEINPAIDTNGDLVPDVIDKKLNLNPLSASVISSELIGESKTILQIDLTKDLAQKNSVFVKTSSKEIKTAGENNSIQNALNAPLRKYINKLAFDKIKGKSFKNWSFNEKYLNLVKISNWDFKSNEEAIYRANNFISDNLDISNSGILKLDYSLKIDNPIFDKIQSAKNEETKEQPHLKKPLSLFSFSNFKIDIYKKNDNFDLGELINNVPVTAKTGIPLDIIDTDIEEQLTTVEKTTLAPLEVNVSSKLLYSVVMDYSDLYADVGSFKIKGKNFWNKSIEVDYKTYIKNIYEKNARVVYADDEGQKVLYFVPQNNETVEEMLRRNFGKLTLNFSGEIHSINGKQNQILKSIDFTNVPLKTYDEKLWIYLANDDLALSDQAKAGKTYVVGYFSVKDLLTASIETKKVASKEDESKKMISKDGISSKPILVGTVKPYDEVTMEFYSSAQDAYILDYLLTVIEWDKVTRCNSCEKCEIEIDYSDRGLTFENLASIKGHKTSQYVCSGGISGPSCYSASPRTNPKQLGLVCKSTSDFDENKRSCNVNYRKISYKNSVLKPVDEITPYRIKFFMIDSKGLKTEIQDSEIKAMGTDKLDYGKIKLKLKPSVFTSDEESLYVQLTEDNEQKLEDIGYIDTTCESKFHDFFETRKMKGISEKQITTIFNASIKGFQRRNWSN